MQVISPENILCYNLHAYDVDAQYRCSSKAVIDRFREVLIAAGLTTITRKTRGDDIDAACGQLAGRVQDRTRRRERLVIKASQA